MDKSVKILRLKRARGTYERNLTSFYNKMDVKFATIVLNLLKKRPSSKDNNSFSKLFLNSLFWWIISSLMIESLIFFGLLISAKNFLYFINSSINLFNFLKTFSLLFCFIFLFIPINLVNSSFSLIYLR